MKDMFPPAVRTEVSKSVSPIRMLWLLNKLEQNYNWLADARARRLSYLDWLMQIRNDAEGGEIALIVWQRDCDCCEGTSRHILPANPKVINAYINCVLDSAEGPVRYWIDKPSAYFEPEHRDRALEAFEDGHPFYC